MSLTCQTLRARVNMRVKIERCFQLLLPSVKTDKSVRTVCVNDFVRSKTNSVALQAGLGEKIQSFNECGTATSKTNRMSVLLPKF